MNRKNTKEGRCHMINIEEIYYKLTNVDISQQRILWDERGKGYYGEYLVFREIYPTLPGNCKILMNINIPAAYGRTTEIDLLLIHETGLYVFEMKHYKGTIYGKPNQSHWTQYFRTTANQSFRSPIAQNQYHIEALQKIAPSIPVHSLIVFTNPECDLKVECSEPTIELCTLPSLRYRLNALTSRQPVLNMEQIDHLFRTLLTYSPTMQQPITVEGEEIPFYEYIAALTGNYLERVRLNEANFRTKVEEERKECQNQIKKAQISCEVASLHARTKVITTIIVAAAVTLSCILGCILICGQHKKYSDAQIASAQQELSDYVEKYEAFAQKFEHVEPYNNGEIRFSYPLVSPENIQLRKSNDLVDTVVFSGTLVWSGEEYGVCLTEDTKYIIQLKDGSVREYNLFNSDFHYYSLYKLGTNYYRSFSLPEIEFYDLQISDIEYIKLINTEIWKPGANSDRSLFTGYEIALYW